MVVFQISIHQAKVKLHFQMDILRREDGTDKEVECAKAMETFFLDMTKYVAKEQGLILKTRRTRPKTN